MARDQGPRSKSRRKFCWTFAGVLVAPELAIAQPATKVRRIGVLSPGDSDSFSDLAEPLRRLGWIEGKNIALERRFAKWPVNLRSALAELAEELVRLKVELIITSGSEAALAAKNATTTIPIVMAGAGDPVVLGIVASYARPGGNITGYSVPFYPIASKRAELLHELLPALQRVAVSAPPRGYARVTDLVRDETDRAYRALGVQPIFIEISRTTQYEDILAEAARHQAQAWQFGGLPPGTNLGAVMQAAIGHRLPTLVGDRDMLEAGGLLYLDYNEQDMSMRVAAIIDKILRGAKPADIPIEQPTRFTLMINMRTARALGLTVPQSLLLRADEVI